MSPLHENNKLRRNSRAGSRVEACVLLAAAVFPSFVVWLWFGPLADSRQAVQLFAHMTEKAVQLVLPLAWVAYCSRGSFGWPRTILAGVRFGVSFGATIAIATVLLYAIWLRPTGSLLAGVAPILQKVRGLGIDTPTRYIVWATLIALANSAMEEYYWRWFLFGRLRLFVPTWAAIALSSVAFAAHHVIILGTFFGWNSWPMVLFSISVAVGGGVWAWLYNRSGSLLGPWLSHILIDAAIFVIGYDLIFASSASASMSCFSRFLTS